MKWPALIRDNLFVAACVAASVLLHVAALVAGQRMAGPAMVLLPVPAGPAVTPAKVPAQALPKTDPAEKLAPAPKLKPESKPEPNPAPHPAEKKPAAPKSPPKRIEKHAPPQAAKPPAKANPGEADLVPLQLGVPEPMGVDMGQVVRIQIENRGRAAAGTHHDALFYSASGKLDGKAARLGMVEVPGTLAPGAKRWARAQVLLPEKTPSGRAYLIVVLNADGAMPETNHANNQITVPIMVDAQSVPLGDPDARPRTTVAWISSKDFRQLKAAQSRTLQPAVQNDATTTPDARPDVLAGTHDAAPIHKGVTAAKAQKKSEAKTVEVAHSKPAEAAPPKVKSEALVAAKPEVPKTPVTPEAKATPVSPAVAKPAPKPEAPKKVEVAKAAPIKEKIKPREGQTVDPKAPQLALAAPEKQAAGKPPATDKAGNNPPAKAAEEKGAKPAVASATEPVKKTVEAKPETGAPQQGEGATSATADRSSALPTQLDESSLERQPGRVLVGKGVRITTARIRQPSAAALIAGVAANPRMAVTFNAAGEAVKVEMLKASGNSEWDAVVTESMYRWTAEGDEVKKGGLVVRWTVLLGAED